MELQRILVPTDFSPGAQEAVRTAVELAKGRDAEVVLLHVIEAPWTAPYGFTEAVPATTERLRRAAESRLAETVAAESRSGVKFRGVLREGNTVPEIMKVAREEDADLIVLGSAGYSAGTYAIFGTTAERVARKASFPVLLARPKGAAIA